MPERRFDWVVETLAVAPDENLLEVGCGHGVALTLVCELLTTGTATGLDRSAKMIEMAARRNTAHLESGRLRLLTAPLARAELGNARFDTIFAVNVGLFWRGDATRELAVIGTHLAPGGRLLLFHEPPPGSTAAPTPQAAVDQLTANGFDVVTTPHAGPDAPGWVASWPDAHRMPAGQVPCQRSEAGDGLFQIAAHAQAERRVGVLAERSISTYPAPR